MLDQCLARRHAAGPAFAAGVEAELIRGRRVDPAEPDASGADLDLVGLADLRHAGDIGGLRQRRQQQKRQQQFHEHERPG